jgi:hypothetical protein
MGWVRGMKVSRRLESWGVAIGLGCVLVGGIMGGLTEVRSAVAKPMLEEQAYRSGKLRVSNRSEHPIRLALRVKAEKAQGDKYNEKVSNPLKYESPAHWDFYAGEGGDRGLLVALPSRSVYLKKGDVVVAFAQDGSQKYWGPFVVGETDNPVWNDRTAEWQLVLEP